jgi:hypothetical protein
MQRFPNILGRGTRGRHRVFGGTTGTIYLCHYLMVLPSPNIIIIIIIIKLKLSLCLTKHHSMETYWESADTAPRILDLDTIWR